MTDFNVKFDAGESFNVDFGVSIPQYDYEGSYNITPTEEQQTLITANRLLERNIEVSAIPPQYVVPTGTETITTLGVHNIADKESVNVQTSLKEGVIRPDAELVKTFTFDKMAVADLNITLPAYTTTATVFLDTENLEEIIAPDDEYRYFIVEKFCAIPTYNRTDHLKGRVEYMVSTTCYDLVFTPPNYYKSLSNGELYASSQRVTQANGAVTKQPYYSSDNTFAIYTSSTYGIGATVQAPAVSSGKIVCKSPKWQLRGSANYFTSTYWNAMTDIRLQYVIEVWREPVGSLGIDGWNATQVLNHMVECAQSNTHKLT